MDDKLNLIKIQYNDGELITLSYGDEYGYCSDMYMTQDIRTDLKIGQSFKKGDILIYNAGFFKKDNYTNQVDWKHGTYANVALLEVGGTFEDSSMITRQFGNKLSMNPVFERIITFSKDNVVISCMSEGQIVDVNDKLIVLEDADVSSFTMTSQLSEDVEDYLIGLNRVAPKSKYSGTIVKVNAFYGSEIKTMHPSIAKIIRKINEINEAKHVFSQGTTTAVNYAKPQPLPKDSKYKRDIQFTEDTVVLQFFIQETLEAGVGDKIVIDSSLKTVIADILEEPAIAESGQEIDCIFSASSVSNRIVNSPVLVGIAERCIEELEKQVIEIYDKL